jgi:putative heme iron utilization protein
VRSEEERQLVSLLRTARWAALATARDGEPLSTWVAVVAEEDLCGYLLHLSRLALHTRYLEVNPQASLGFTEPDADTLRDPQTLARVSLQGRVAWIGRDSGEYESACARYLARLPHAAVQFGLGDFALARFVPVTARYVPGFGRVHRVSPEELRALAR